MLAYVCKILSLCIYTRSCFPNNWYDGCHLIEEVAVCLSLDLRRLLSGVCPVQDVNRTDTTPLGLMLDVGQQCYTLGR